MISRKNKAAFPSVESMQKMCELPKVRLLFYHEIVQYCVNGKIGKKWANNIEDENTRLSVTPLLEAHILTEIEDHYFQWVFEFLVDVIFNKEKGEDVSFQLEYEAPEDMKRLCDVQFPNIELVEMNHTRSDRETTNEYSVNLSPVEFAMVEQGEEDLDNVNDLDSYETLEEKRVKMQHEIAKKAAEENRKESLQQINDLRKDLVGRGETTNTQRKRNRIVDSLATLSYEFDKQTKKHIRRRNLSNKKSSLLKEYQKKSVKEEKSKAREQFEKLYKKVMVKYTCETNKNKTAAEDDHTFDWEENLFEFAV